MKLFGKRWEKLSPRQDVLAAELAGRIVRNQRRLADWLNRKTAGLTVRGWLLILVAFCIAFGSYCLWLLAEAF